jgi:hypothetical protein
MSDLFPYTHWQFLYPPRPEKAVSPSFLSFYERRGWVLQMKKNGTCTLVGVDPEGHLHTISRHNTQHTHWQPTERTRKLEQFCPKGSWTVFVAELMNDKGPTKDTLYIHDLIVLNNKQLIGSTFLDRQFLLEQLFPDLTDTSAKSLPTGYQIIAPGLWLADLITENFVNYFELIKKMGDKENEGVVLKNPAGKLALMFQNSKNSDWQVKIRVTNENLMRTV